MSSVSMTNSFAVVGVDPGTMTGLFVYQYCPSQCCNGETITQMHAAADDVWGKLKQGGIRFDKHIPTWRMYFAVERFIITARTAKLTQNTDALEVTGMVRAAANIGGGTGIRRYAKANLKFASDDALKRAGWYDPKMRHANDAARQAFALLHEVDYPTWLRVSNGGMMKTEDE